MMAQTEGPKVFITVDDKRQRTFVYHLWRSVEDEVDADISDAPGNDSTDGAVRGEIIRAVPPIMRLTIDLRNVQVPVAGPSSNVYQNKDFDRQLADLKAMHLKVVKVTTRMSSLLGIVKSVRAIDDGYPKGARVVVEIRPIVPLADGGKVRIGRIVLRDIGIDTELDPATEARTQEQLFRDLGITPWVHGGVQASGNPQCAAKAGADIFNITTFGDFLGIQTMQQGTQDIMNALRTLGDVVGSAFPIIQPTGGIAGIPLVGAVDASKLVPEFGACPTGGGGFG